METFSAMLAICARNSPVAGEFPAQRPVIEALMFSFICATRLSKQSWGWWFEIPFCPLWRHCNVLAMITQFSDAYSTDINIYVYNRVSIFNQETAGNARTHNQHSGCWWPGAKAPGHQYPQCCLSICCIGPVPLKILHLPYMILTATSIETVITFWKKDPVV